MNVPDPMIVVEIQPPIFHVQVGGIYTLEKDTTLFNSVRNLNLNHISTQSNIPELVIDQRNSSSIKHLDALVAIAYSVEDMVAYWLFEKKNIIF